ncbi:MAG: hypothetical protein CMJ31_10770 [Phycisphaerae bacterium]|nr:hypothetical protein [Phycisphaerae bacterium]
MFDQFKAFGAIADILKNKDKIQDAAERVQDRLTAVEVIGEAGGGVAKVVALGSLRVVRTEISPALAAGLASADVAQKAMAEQMLADATNDALMKAQMAARRVVEEEAEAMGLGGLAGQLGGLVPGLPGGTRGG